MMLCKNNIFISHSSNNKEIAEQLCAFLVKLGINENKIFCSSIIGQGVNNGEKLNEAIASAIQHSRMLIYIISRDFLQSSYCMEELGIGWFLSQKMKTTCFYLIIPDITLSELNGFVNSKIDKFAFIDDKHKDDLGLFAENICEKLHLKLPKHSVLVNAENTFFSATQSAITQLIEQTKMAKEETTKKEQELEKLNDKIQGLNNTIQTLKYDLNSKDKDINKRLLKNELDTIRGRFFYFGFGSGVSKEIYGSLNKSFWFKMIDRYLELEQELGYSCYDYNMEMLMASVYSANGDFDEAHKHLKLYVMNCAVSIYPSHFKNININNIRIIEDLIQILQERIKATPRGLAQDSYKKTLEYLINKKSSFENIE